MFLPLSPYEIMFFEVFFVEVFIETLVVRARVRQDDLALGCVLEGLVDVPPPSVVLEEIHNKLGVVSFSNKDLVELKLTSLKVQIDLV